MGTRRLRVILGNEDLPEATLALVGRFPGLRIYCGTSPRTELDAEDLNRIEVEGVTIWYRPSILRDASHVIAGKQVLTEGDFAFAADGRPDSLTAATVTAVWKAIRSCTEGGLWTVNPVVGTPLKPEKSVRVGPHALQFLRDGGLLGSANAHLFFTLPSLTL